LEISERFVQAAAVVFGNASLNRYFRKTFQVAGELVAIFRLVEGLAGSGRVGRSAVQNGEAEPGGGVLRGSFGGAPVAFDGSLGSGAFS
jgi:hypothetical protein